MNKKYIIILSLLIVILAISSFFIIKEFVENKKETEIYEDLQEIVIEENTDIETRNVDTEIEKSEGESSNKYNLENIHYESVDSLLRIRIQNICELSCY